MRFLPAQFRVVALAILAIISLQSFAQAQYFSSVIAQSFTPAGASRAKLQFDLHVSTDVPNAFNTSIIDFTAGANTQMFGDPVNGHYEMDLVMRIWNDDFGPTALDLDRVELALLHNVPTVGGTDMGFLVAGTNEETSGYFADPPSFGPGAFPTVVAWNAGLLPAIPFASYPTGIAVFETQIRLDTVDNFPGSGFQLKLKVGTQSVPEIDPAGMGSVLALVGGALGLLERRRPKVA